jgi:hypothetical protein
VTFHGMQAGRISAWRITREVLYPDAIEACLAKACDGRLNLAIVNQIVWLLDRRIDFDWLAGFFGAYDRDGTFSSATGRY